MNAISLVVSYLAIINIIAFFAFGIDKWKARKRRWRISEYSLLMLAVVGGSVGAILGMRVWRHKTLHAKFRYGLPVILLVQIALCAYMLK